MPKGFPASFLRYQNGKKGVHHYCRTVIGVIIVWESEPKHQATKEISHLFRHNLD